jgi:hypothetical protein
MILKPGVRLKSQVDSTQLIVVRAPAGDLALCCGGHPMIELAAEPTVGLTAAETGDAARLGKRYSARGLDELEVLVTKAGSFALAVGDTPLEVKAAKPLPASD